MPAFNNELSTIDQALVQRSIVSWLDIECKKIEFNSNKTYDITYGSPSNKNFTYADF